MRKFLPLLLCLTAVFAFANSESWAQGRRVTGKITSSEDGSALPGVNVVLKGTTEGTVSDGVGNYALDVPQAGGILVFSFIGLLSQEAEVGSRATIDIQMAQDVQQLTEVVITALGEQRNARELVYANQTVKSEDLLSTPSKNALEALRGKTAGVRITTGSGSVGASTRIVLRGEASLTGDNNALIVVDGVPINNNSSFGGAQEGEAGYSDYGNRFNDFNPENIETLTILQGPAATALYGSRGASGVVVITTKSGSRDRMKVNFSSTTSFERAYVLLKRQDEYGQGLINPDGSNSFDSGENFSWGPRFDNVVRPWTSPVDTDGDGDFEYLSRPYSAVNNQLQDLFNTGTTFNNNVSFSGGNENFTYFASYGNVSQKGILENTDYERHNITLNASAKLSKKIKSRFSLNYSNVDQNTAQEGSRAFEGQNPYASAVQAPVNIPYSELRDYKNPYHSFTGYYGSYAINPYFILNEFVNNGRINNFLASVSLDYSPIENLTLSTALGTNFVTLDRTTAVPKYQYTDHYVWENNLSLVERGERQFNAGFYEELLSNSETIDWTTKANYNTDLSEKLNFNATVGVNYWDVRNRVLIGATRGGFSNTDDFNLGNSLDLAQATQNHFGRRIIGLFANLTFSWDNKIFLEYAGRNDWSSTLPSGSNRFDYHSLGANVIVSDYLNLQENPIINYFKFRAGAGTTGKDATPYLLSSVYVSNPTLIEFDDTYQVKSPLAGQPTASRANLIGNANLKPEKTYNYEVGADFGFFNNKVQLVYTYYLRKHEEQILEAQIPSSSGYTTVAANIGLMENQGHEVALTLVPIDRPDGLRWDMTVTWSRNRNLVKAVTSETDELTYYNSGRGITQVAKVGYPLGTWKGQAPRFTESGQQIVDANGNPAYTTEAQVLENTQADWIGGLGTSLKYKGIRLGALLDTRQGGTIFSLTKTAVEFNGTSISSTINDRIPFVIPNSVVDNGDGTFSPNTTAIGVDTYVDDGNYSRHILDGSFVKLREITLGYTLPRNIVSKLHMQQASINLFVKNPQVWLPSENVYADPEVNNPVGTANNTSGVESTQTPISKSYGVNLNITF